MLPTFNSSGDVVVAEHVSHRLGRLAPGDVIVVQSPDNPKRTVIKRLLALEGDKVSFFDPHRIRQHATVVVISNFSSFENPKGPALQVWIFVYVMVVVAVMWYVKLFFGLLCLLGF